MKLNTVFAGAAIALGVAAAAMGAGPANAGQVQPHPLAYLQTIFDQQSILNDTFGKGIEINLLPSQTVQGQTNGIGADGAAINALVSAAGLTNSLTIPVFYIDSYTSASLVGLADLGDNGVTVLTSYQEDLKLHPDIFDSVTCTADHGYPCSYIYPEVTAADLPNGWLASATVVAHEIGHNLGLGHVSGFPDLMNPSATPYDQIWSGAYSLTDSQVETILDSPFVQTAANGQRFIDVETFSVLAVPEPSTWLYMVVAMAFCGGVIRRARRASLALAPMRTIRA